MNNPPRRPARGVGTTAFVCLLITAGGALRTAESSNAAATSALSGFHTTGWAAQCVVPEDALGGPVPLLCWTPNDGFTVSMSSTGRPKKTYSSYNRGYRDQIFARRHLAYERHWNFRVTYSGELYHCTSKRTGLTCWNQRGHGWWLGRYRGYRLF